MEKQKSLCRLCKNKIYLEYTNHDGFEDREYYYENCKYLGTRFNVGHILYETRYKYTVTKCNYFDKVSKEEELIIIENERIAKEKQAQEDLERDVGYRLEQAQRDYDMIMGGACISSFQDINRTYTNNERALAVRIDCSTEAQ